MGKQKESIFGYLTQSWSEERKMTGLVIALMFDTLIGYPLVSVISSSVAIRLINDLVISAVLLLGLFALTRHKITRMVLGGIILIVISVRSARFVFGAHWLLGWDILLSLVAVIAYCEFYHEICLQRRPSNLAAHSSSRCRIPAHHNRIRFRLYSDLLSYPRGLQVPG